MENEAEKAFEEWLLEDDPDQDLFYQRQRKLRAWRAGAEWAMKKAQEIQAQVTTTPPPTSEERRGGTER